MRMRSRSREEPEEFNVWQASTDLMANAFMIISLFLLITLFKSLINRSELESKISNLTTDSSELVTEMERLKAEVNRLEATNSRLDAEVNRSQSAPPVLIIRDSGAYQFSSGQAEIPEALRRYIWTSLVTQIEQITQERDLYIVEVIGHTDGQATGSRASNIDQFLDQVVNGTGTARQLTPGSNADLGLMRAVEVVRQLQHLQKQGRLQGLQFRAYSAAQLHLPSGDFAPVNRNPDSTRRRIEIRFTPIGEATMIQ